MAAVGKRDYYEVLGVERKATPQEIKSAYRRIAVQHHPDKNPGDKRAEDLFKEAAEAYSVLADPEKRAIYDQYGHTGLKGGPAVSQDIFRDFSDIFGGGLFEELFGFGEIFGSSRRRRGGARRGADLRYDLEITFDEAFKGLETRLRIPRLEACAGCGGTGLAPGTHRSVCSTCGGHGQVRFQQGFLTVARTCGRCAGTGSIIANPCTACKGEGRVGRERELTVKIPAGVDSGSRLRLVGEGEAGTGNGPPGDLYVVVAVGDHPFFKRQDDDLLCQIPVTFPQAAMGAEIEIPTLEGVEKITLPEGTQTGTVFSIKAKGFPHVRGAGRGNLVVSILVMTPRRLTREQRKLFKQLGELIPPIPLKIEDLEKDKGFLEKLLGL